MNGNRIEELIQGGDHRTNDEVEQNNSTSENKVDNKTTEIAQPEINRMVQKKMSPGMGVGILAFFVILLVITVVTVRFLRKKRRQRNMSVH